MLDHVLIYVPASKFDQVVAWYSEALAPLGYAKQKEFPGKAAGFGPGKLTMDFWIGTKESEEQVVYPTHVAFRAGDRATVEEFHEVATKAGGESNGKPGWRHQYHAKYYASFVLDPIGNNIEVVDHGDVKP